MAQYFEVHPDNPQPRLLKQAVALLARGGIVAVPTDSSYALACHLDDKAAADRLRQIRRVDDKHHLTLLCRDLSELANYARVDNRQYRLLKSATPGPYTFILEATREVPRRVSHPQRKTIGLRVPDHRVLQELLALHGAPLLATTLIAPRRDRAAERRRRRSASASRTSSPRVIDAGACPSEPTTVIDLTPMGTGGDAGAGARRAAATLARSGCERLLQTALRQSRRVDINNLIQTVLIYALPVLFAITVHEAAHGYVARALRRQHRLHAGPRHAQPDQAHRPDRHHR